MIGSKDENLKTNLKKLIIEECDKDVEVTDINDDDVLFSEECVLELDSMDALQISMALQKEYNIEANDSKKLRKIMVSINSLADYIQPE